MDDATAAQADAAATPINAAAATARAWAAPAEPAADNMGAAQGAAVASADSPSVSSVKTKFGGIFPDGGVAAANTENAEDDVRIKDKCKALFYSLRCADKVDPLQANAIISEIANVVKKADNEYDCGRLDNLAIAIEKIIKDQVYGCTAFPTLNDTDYANPIIPLAIARNLKKNCMMLVANPSSASSLGQGSWNEDTVYKDGIKRLIPSPSSPKMGTFFPSCKKYILPENPITGEKQNPDSGGFFRLEDAINGGDIDRNGMEAAHIISAEYTSKNDMLIDVSGVLSIAGIVPPVLSLIMAVYVYNGYVTVLPDGYLYPRSLSTGCFPDGEHTLPSQIMRVNKGKVKIDVYLLNNTQPGANTRAVAWNNPLSGGFVQHFARLDLKIHGE